MTLWQSHERSDAYSQNADAIDGSIADGGIQTLFDQIDGSIADGDIQKLFDQIDGSIADDSEFYPRALEYMSIKPFVWSVVATSSSWAQTVRLRTRALWRSAWGEFSSVWHHTISKCISWHRHTHCSEVEYEPRVALHDGVTVPHRWAVVHLEPI